MNPAMLKAALDELVVSQPWFKRNANTVTAAWTGLLVLGGVLLTSDTGLPSWVTYLVGGLLYLGQLLGIAKTPNGVTPTVVDKVTSVVEERYGKHAK